MNGIDRALYIKHSTTWFEEFLFIGRIVWVLRRLEVGQVLGCETRFTKKHLSFISSFVLNSQFLIRLYHPFFLGVTEWRSKRIGRAAWHG